MKTQNIEAKCILKNAQSDPLRNAQLDPYSLIPSFKPILEFPKKEILQSQKIKLNNKIINN